MVNPVTVGVAAALYRTLSKLSTGLLEYRLAQLTTDDPKASLIRMILATREKE